VTVYRLDDSCVNSAQSTKTQPAATNIHATSASTNNDDVDDEKSRIKILSAMHPPHQIQKQLAKT